LVKCGESRGIEVRQGEAAIEVVAESQGIKVTTESDIYMAKVLVVADGANSFVKRQLKWSNGSRIARLLEILTPENAEERFEFREGVAVFDFTPMMKGLQGYYWDFPNLVNGKPTMNRGVFDSHIHPDIPRIHLKDEFEVQLSKRGRNLSEYQLKGHPIHWFNDEAEFSRPHTLLVGDAAGTDPLLGEGIPFALAYGGAAALEIVEGWERGDFSFSTYRARVLEYPLLEQLRHRASAARFLHRLPKRPWLSKYFLKLFPVIFNSLAAYKPRYIPAQSPRMIRGNLDI
jgi:flavin-dependent dehydrogenase